MNTDNTTITTDARLAERATALVRELGPDIGRFLSAVSTARCIVASEALSTGFPAITSIVATTEWEYDDQGGYYTSPTFKFQVAGLTVALDSGGELREELDDDEAEKLAELLPAAASEPDAADAGDMFFVLQKRLTPAFELAASIYWNAGSRHEGDDQIYPMISEQGDEA